MELLLLGIFFLLSLVIIGFCLFIGKDKKDTKDTKDKSPQSENNENHTSEDVILEENEHGEPMYLFVDTETNSIDPDKLALQIAWIITDKFGKVCKKESYYLKREIDIDFDASAINGITQDFLLEVGEDPYTVFKRFKDDLSTVEFIVGHNLEFDLEVLRNEFPIYGFSLSALERVTPVCTMKWSYDYVGATNKYGKPKNPRLEETAGFLLFDDKDHIFYGLHNALADAELTMICFFKLLAEYPPYSPKKKQNVTIKIELENNPYIRKNDPNKEKILDEVVFLSDEELDAMSKEDLFTNKKYLITGYLYDIGYSDRDEVKQLLTDLGALPQKSMVKSLDYLIIGEEFGPAKIAEVIKRQKEGTPLRCLKAIQFYRMTQKFKD